LDFLLAGMVPAIFPPPLALTTATGRAAWASAARGGTGGLGLVPPYALPLWRRQAIAGAGLFWLPSLLVVLRHHILDTGVVLVENAQVHLHGGQGDHAPAARLGPVSEVPAGGMASSRALVRRARRTT
jgi:hypothetical protein